MGKQVCMDCADCEPGCEGIFVIVPRHGKWVQKVATNGVQLFQYFVYSQKASEI